MSKFTKAEEGTQQHNQSGFGQRFSNLRVITYLAMVGLSSAFLFLTISYFVTTFGTAFNNLQLPFIFHANTIIIIFSSYAINQTRKAAAANDYDNYLKSLLATGGLGIAFIVFQFVGWSEMIAKGIDLKNVAGMYLYVITALHVLHLLVGIGLIAVHAWNAYALRSDAVKQLLFEIDPMTHERIDMLATYWHFVDGLWVYLYLFFVLTIYALQ